MTEALETRKKELETERQKLISELIKNEGSLLEIIRLLKK